MAKSTTVAAKNSGRTGHFLSGRETLATGVFVAGLAIFLAVSLLQVWPSSSAVAGKVIWTGFTEGTGLAIAMLAGALGAFIHVATSFASYAGNRSISASWVWWFALRPPLGAALALVAYFIMRSGLLLDGALGVQVTPFGIAALGAIVGLASKQIIDKMRNVADTTFNTAEDSQRSDKL